MGKHVDQPVDTEEIDATSHQVTDAWLGHPKELRPGSLGQFPAFKDPSHVDHQLRAHPEVLDFLRWKAYVSEHVAGRALHFRRHAIPPCAGADQISAGRSKYVFS